MPTPIRVVLVDDSRTLRECLYEVLRNDPGFEVVGVGESGRDAIELAQRLKPDVISLDLMMPVMSGVAATEYIMGYCATPIVIVSAAANQTEALRTFDALAAGAVDVFDKPSAEHGLDDVWARRYLSVLRTASRVRVITHPRARLNRPSVIPLATPTPDATVEGPRCVMLGVSTGGPQALMQLLPALASDFPLPILLVVHLDPSFERSFRDWLAGYSPLPVRYARHGEPLPPVGTGIVLMAPADQHLVVESGHLRLLRTPERHSCRPSVDVLFESGARELGAGVVAGLLTGMGADGAGGLLALRQAGATTLAQDEATSVIYGMPGAAVKLGAAQQILPIDQIAPALLQFARGVRRVLA